MGVFQVGFAFLLIAGLVALLIFSRYQWKEYKDRRAFERAVFEYMKANGFTKVKLGKGTKDNGIDCKGYKEGKLYIVQAKHYKRASVGLPIVKELVGTCALFGAVPVLAVLHTTRITKDAQQYVDYMRIIVWKM